jgi:CHAD domain-containing protein
MPHLEPLLEALERRRDDARAALLADLNSPRYVELLERLVEGARHPRLSEQAQQPSRTAFPPLGRRAWRKLRDPARALNDDSPAEDFHRVRVLAKRARYAAEAVAPALPRRARRQAERFARRAADIQDVLGELQDSVVATQTINRFAQERPQQGPLNRAAGRMLEREHRAAEGARAEFPRAWRRLDRKQRRSWLR